MLIEFDNLNEFFEEPDKGTTSSDTLGLIYSGATSFWGPPTKPIYEYAYIYIYTVYIYIYIQSRDSFKKSTLRHIFVEHRIFDA